MKLQLTYKMNGILYDYAMFESTRILKDWISSILKRGATEVKIIELSVSKTNFNKGAWIGPPSKEAYKEISKLVELMEAERIKNQNAKIT